jgi:NTP pyrophosphatase (non-canonical NTP hydrolase)
MRHGEFIPTGSHINLNNRIQYLMGYLTDGLTFNVLRQANLKRLPLFKNKKGEAAHSTLDGSDWSPAQWLQAVMGELGEYANLRKKFERGDITEEEFKVEARKELADVQVYLDILAFQLGINLGEATISKFNEVSERINCSIRIRKDGSDWHSLPQNT